MTLPNRPPDRPAAGPSGSTLIELIVVLVVVSLLFGIAVPALTSVDRAPERSPMDSARLAAVGTGQVVHLVAADTLAAFTALPDGRVIGGSVTHAR